VNIRRMVLLAFLGSVALVAPAQPVVRVEPANLTGPRPLEQQTAKAVIQDYLESWQKMAAALEQNRADLLDADFIGDARDKLAATIREQAGLGISTYYRDRSHDLQIVFYSPEGLSIELTDTVEYEVQLFDHGNLKATQTEHARYIAVLTPTEVRWRVRIFQALPE
jgi:hypothetical protein